MQSAVDTEYTSNYLRLWPSEPESTNPHYTTLSLIYHADVNIRHQISHGCNGELNASKKVIKMFTIYPDVSPAY